MPRMTILGWSSLFVLAYVILAWGTYQLSAGLAPFFITWLPGGLLATALLLSAPRRWPLFLTIALIINLGSGLLVGLPVRANIVYSFSSTLECLIAVYFARRLPVSLPPDKNIRRFTGLLLAGAALGAALNASLVAIVTPESPGLPGIPKGWGVIWTGHFLGMILGFGLAAYQELSSAISHVRNEARSIEKQLEIEQLFHTLFEESFDSLVVCNLENHFPIEYNDQACHLFGYTREDFSKLPLPSLLGKVDQERIFEALGSSLNQAIASFETIIQRQDGEIRNVIINIKKVSHSERHLYLTSFHDITQQKKNEEQLLFQAHLLDNVSQAIITTGTSGRITFWNRAAEELYGWKSNEVTGKELVQIFPSRVNKETRLDVMSWLAAWGSWSGEIEMQRRDKSRFLAQIDEMPILDNSGHIIGTVNVSHDITTRKASEDALRKSNFMRDILSASLMNTPLALIFWKVERSKIEVIDWNPAADTIFGWKREEIIGKNFFDFLPARKPEKTTTELIRPIGSESLPPILPNECRNREGDTVLIDWFSTPLTDLENDLIYVVSLGENVTERKRAEDQIRGSLLEKEILLREVYHRVKNNLMVMISLIDLQAANINDQETISILKDLQGRIRAMAMVHQSLYQSPSLAEVDFEGYLIALTSYLRALFTTSRAVEVTYQVEKLALRIELAIPCGLIINELVSNAFKYAFPASWKKDQQLNEPCSVFIAFRKIGELYVLEIKDNGVGLPEDLDIQNCHSLGIQLVRILTTQIDGVIEANRAEGTWYKITFKDRRG